MENPFNSLNVSIIKNEEKSDLETLLEFRIIKNIFS